MQERLFEFLSPLDLKVGRDFFTTLPKSAGVYRMFGDQGELLYVGKSINLKSRLMSYRHVDVSSGSRKTLKLVHQVAKIEYEICSDEESALIRENELLRVLKPPFNVANTRPETYFFFKVKISDEPSIDSHRIPIVLSIETENRDDDDGAIFGAFKNLGRCQKTFFALKRMMWLVHDFELGFDFSYPSHLTKKQRLSPAPMNLSKVWLNRLAGFFHGFSLAPVEKEPELVTALKQNVKLIKNCDGFYQTWFAQDIDEIHAFYKTGTARNSKLKSMSSADSPIIEKIQVDDLIVKSRFLQAKSV